MVSGVAPRGRGSGCRPREGRPQAGRRHRGGPAETGRARPPGPILHGRIQAAARARGRPRRPLRPAEHLHRPGPRAHPLGLVWLPERHHSEQVVQPRNWALRGHAVRPRLARTGPGHRRPWGRHLTPELPRLDGGRRAQSVDPGHFANGVHRAQGAWSLALGRAHRHGLLLRRGHRRDDLEHLLHGRAAPMGQGLQPGAAPRHALRHQLDAGPAGRGVRAAPR